MACKFCINAQRKLAQKLCKNPNGKLCQRAKARLERMLKDTEKK